MRLSAEIGSQFVWRSVESADHFRDYFRVFFQRDSCGLRQGLACDVVISGPESAGYDYQIGFFSGEGDGFGWASFSGKATYREPGWPEPIGNYYFLTYVEDWGEPGVNDRFWIEVQDSDGVIQTLALPRDAVSNAEVIDGGNIVVPHVRGKKE